MSNKHQTKSAGLNPTGNRRRAALNHPIAAQTKDNAAAGKTSAGHGTGANGAEGAPSGACGDAETATPRALPAAAVRALAEAEARRQKGGGDKSNGAHPDRAADTEVGGRDGPEPTRYGDWEKNGIVSDF